MKRTIAAVLFLAVPFVILAQGAPPESPPGIDWELIMLIVQALIPAVGPALTAWLKGLLGDLDPSTAVWVNWLINLLAQLFAALAGGNPAVGAVLAGWGGLSGSKMRDMLKGKKYAAAHPEQKF